MLKRPSIFLTAQVYLMVALAVVLDVCKEVGKAVLEPLYEYHQRHFCMHLIPEGVHIDVPLSNMCVQAFGNGQYVAPFLFPVVNVDKQSNKYFIIDKSAWLRLPPTTKRGIKQAPKRVEWTSSSDSYYAENYALAGEVPLEVYANADNALQVRNRQAMFVTDMLARDFEQRVASKVTSISNVGSGVALAGGAKWSNYVSSDPISDVTTARAFIRQNTGLTANTMVIDADTYEIVRRHPVLLDMFKYTESGLLNTAQLASVFEVPNIRIASGVKETSNEGSGVSSMAPIWGNNVLICYVDPSPSPDSMQVQTFGAALRWNNPEYLGVPMAARRYMDPDPGKKLEIVEVGYYQDEKVIAQQLSYLIGSTL